MALSSGRAALLAPPTLGKNACLEGQKTDQTLLRDGKEG